MKDIYVGARYDRKCLCEACVIRESVRGGAGAFAETLAWHMIFHIATVHTLRMLFSIILFSFPHTLFVCTCMTTTTTTTNTSIPHTLHSQSDVLCVLCEFTATTLTNTLVRGSLDLHIAGSLSHSFTILAYSWTFVIGFTRLHNISRLDLGWGAQQILCMLQVSRLLLL